MPAWSYTEWEYHLAHYFNKPTLVYFAMPEAPREPETIPEEASVNEIQKKHKETIRDAGKHWGTFSSPFQLLRTIYHDLGLDLEKVKPNNLPYPSIGSLFKGRDDLLQEIRKSLGSIDHPGRYKPTAITGTAKAATVHGLGGIGKTRTALEYAHRYADEFTSLLFLQADSPQNLKDNLAGLCGPLVLNLPEQNAKDPEKRLAAAINWLKRHPGWFLIIDNVDSEEAAEAVEKLVDKLATSGQILITSRIRPFSAAVHKLDIDVLLKADAVDFLLERTQQYRSNADDDPAQAGVLADELGELALALSKRGRTSQCNEPASPNTSNAGVVHIATC